MSDHSSSIVSKVWNYAHVLKNAGVGCDVLPDRLNIDNPAVPN